MVNFSIPGVIRLYSANRAWRQTPKPLDTIRTISCDGFQRFSIKHISLACKKLFIVSLCSVPTPGTRKNYTKYLWSRIFCYTMVFRLCNTLSMSISKFLHSMFRPNAFFQLPSCHRMRSENFTLAQEKRIEWQKIDPFDTLLWSFHLLRWILICRPSYTGLGIYLHFFTPFLREFNKKNSKNCQRLLQPMIFFHLPQS